MSDRLRVRKTYKLFIGGEFPRSESGRSYPVAGPDGQPLAWASQASRKDVRDAVRTARGAVSGWAGKTPYNRGQILYRVAEVLEGRRSQLIDELTQTGATASEAATEVTAAIDRWVWYAGWADKVHHLAGTVNGVAGPYFNFTVPEPVGVVGLIAPEQPALLGLVSRLAPAIVSGNTVVALASEAAPLAAVTLGEVLATSDLPKGVVNLLTGFRAELVPWLASHLDVDALDVAGLPADLAAAADEAVAEGMTRVVGRACSIGDWTGRQAQSPALITDLMEMKTVWHPMGT